MKAAHIRCLAAIALCVGLLAVPASAINIVPHYVSDANGTWNATEMTVVQDALNDWNTHIAANQTFTVNFDFVHGGIGTYLAQWHASYADIPNGTNIYPWTDKVVHTVDINVDYMNQIMTNQLVFTTGAVPADDWDAYTAILHEMGHAMGFSAHFYQDDVGMGGAFDKWTSHMIGTSFDPLGMNVTMNADQQHLADPDDLMGASLVNGVRKYISNTDLAMLQLAYGYTVNDAAPAASRNLGRSALRQSHALPHFTAAGRAEARRDWDS